MAFLLFDHIGGINTLLYTLSNGGTLVVLHDRSPEVVCQAIETNRVELLPTSPTFLNLLLVSGAHQRYDLSSLQLLTYGTEPMSEGTLRRIHEALPDVTLQQTYGLSELGILRSKSKSSDSLWVKIGGEGFETRVVDGLLEIKARSAMLGYLNAASPFTDDGWFKTGDRVEVDGDYYRILGRISEVINVGGQQGRPGRGRGRAAAGRRRAGRGGLRRAARPARPDRRGSGPAGRGGGPGRFPWTRMRTALATTLPRYKIPQKVLLTTDALHGERFKRMRR